jgi:signal transduction histidine kinase
MLRTVFLVTMLAAVLSVSSLASARQATVGSRAEARAMLTRAIVELKKDQTQAIAEFNKGDARFRDRDLYVFCFGMKDGRTVTHVRPTEIGNDVRTLKDAKGKPFGKLLYDHAIRGKIERISYMFPRPGSDVPAKKQSYVTRVGDLGCGVGYYQ